MLAQELINLFDSRWFGQEIETQSPPTPQEQNPNPEIEEESKKQDLCRLPTLHVRSLSDQSSSMFFNSDQDTVSPTSVLISTSPKLQTILSGKVMEECPRINADKKGCKRPRKKKLSKSLSELEFDELKGFMDLGFVFSEEDKDSRLISIIPGLQRFGLREEENKNKVIGHVPVSRPYLSEAWEVMEREKREKQRISIDWRMTDLSNETNMKDHLKFWAHSVASAVR